MLKHIFFITYLFVISVIYPSATAEKQKKSIPIKDFEQLKQTVKAIKSARNSGRPYTPSISTTPKSPSPHSSQEEKQNK